MTERSQKYKNRTNYLILANGCYCSQMLCICCDLFVILIDIWYKHCSQLIFADSLNVLSFGDSVCGLFMYQIISSHPISLFQNIGFPSTYTKRVPLSLVLIRDVHSIIRGNTHTYRSKLKKKAGAASVDGLPAV